MIRVRHSIDRLEADAARVPVKAAADMARAVRRNAEQGNRTAKANARRTAGSHGKHYPNSFTAESITPLTWEYGPDASRPQGGMSFEFGSRNQPPHLDLAKSADIQGPKFAADVGSLSSRWFW